MPLTLPPDESWLSGDAQVYDVVYIWQNGQWVLDSSVEPLKVLRISDLENDFRPFDGRMKSRGMYGYLPMYVTRYYWAKPGRWVVFGSDQNY